MFSEDPSEGIGGETDIGIEEEESVVGSEVSELPAGVLFSVPAVGKSLGGVEVEVRIVFGELLDDIGCFIFGCIVEYEDFEGWVRGFGESLECGLDTGFFVASWDEYANGDRKSFFQAVWVMGGGLKEFQVCGDHRAG